MPDLSSILFIRTTPVSEIHPSDIIAAVSQEKKK